MKATILYIEQKFEEFNQQMFAGQLPKLPIELSDAKTFLGVCAFKTRKGKDGKKICYDFKLRINTRIDLPEEEIEDTIIHEMIHYFIGYNQLEDASAHGPMFLHMMNTINEKYGKHLSVSHKGTQEQNEQAVDTKQHWPVVAVVKFKDGRYGIQVLPRVQQRIVNYYNKVGNSNEVEKIELYMSNNIYFNRFPNSAALNVQYVDVEEINGSDLDVYIYACQGRILESLNIQTAEDLRRAKWEVANRKAEYSRMEGELQELEAYDRKLACLLNIYGKQVDFYVPEAERSENQ